jgi:hypothetical protein
LVYLKEIKIFLHFGSHMKKYQDIFIYASKHGRNFFPDKGFYQTVHANFDGKFILYSNVQTAGY